MLALTAKLADNGSSRFCFSYRRAARLEERRLPPSEYSIRNVPFAALDLGPLSRLESAGQGPRGSRRATSPTHRPQPYPAFPQGAKIAKRNLLRPGDRPWTSR